MKRSRMVRNRWGPSSRISSHGPQTHRLRSTRSSRSISGNRLIVAKTSNDRHAGTSFHLCTADRAHAAMNGDILLKSAIRQRQRDSGSKKG
jgi:hypothetical protein